MIAALVILALAATAQVQAFPRSDPVSEVLTVVPKHGLVGGVTDTLHCMLPYASEGRKVLDEIRQEQPTQFVAIMKSINTLMQTITTCMTSTSLDDTCVQQVVFTWWQASETLFDEVCSDNQDAASLFKEVKEACFNVGNRVSEVLTVVPKHGVVGGVKDTLRCMLPYASEGRKVLDEIRQEQPTQFVAIMKSISTLMQTIPTCMTSTSLDDTCVQQVVFTWWQASETLFDEVCSDNQDAASLFEEVKEACLSSGL